MIEITEDAAARIRTLIERDGLPEGSGLRVRVLGGGCSGLTYDLDLYPGPAEGDIVVEALGARVFLDPRCRGMLDGSELRWTKSLMNSKFEFHNPNARATCSCGESFAI